MREGIDQLIGVSTFAGLGAAAALQDLIARRVSNWLVVAIAVAGLVAASAEGGLSITSAMAAPVVTVAALLLPWRAAWLGGGDLKMAAACAIWIGIGRLPAFAAAVAFWGGLLAAGSYLACSATARQAIRANLLVGLSRGGAVCPAKSIGRVSVPYVVAIFAGSLTVMLTGNQ